MSKVTIHHGFVIQKNKCFSLWHASTIQLVLLDGHDYIRAARQATKIIVTCDHVSDDRDGVKCSDRSDDGHESN
jgi:hypothetical protein